MANGAACLRSLSNPKTGGYGNYPDAYQGQYWDVGEEPHTNSTVLSHWFYLLSIGGCGNIDDNTNNSAYTVFGITIEKAASIVWQAEQHYLTSSSNYAAARTAMISAATDLFGMSSNEVAQVTNAWYASGVGSAYTGNASPIVGSIIPVCSTSNFTINGLPTGTTATWSSSNPSGLSINSTTGVATVQNGYNGAVTVSATINGSCGTNVVVLSQSVWVGKPYFTSSTPIVGSSQITVGYSANYSIDDVIGETSYSWNVQSNWSIFGTPTEQTCEVIANAPAATKILTFTASNGCGTVAALKSIQSVTSGGGGGGSGGGTGGGGGCTAYTVSPNPSSTTLSVVVPDFLPPCSTTTTAFSAQSALVSSESDTTNTDTTESTTLVQNTATIQSVSLYSSDGQSQIIKQYPDNTKRVDIDVSGLRKGIYYLRVSDGSLKTESHRIVIN